MYYKKLFVYVCFYNEGNLIRHFASTDQQGSSEFLGENKIITEGKKMLSSFVFSTKLCILY